MWNRLDYRKKKWMLIALSLFVLYAGYIFSFRKTIEAVALNRQLSSRPLNGPIGNGSMIQMRRKYNFYQQVLKSYRVKVGDEDDRVWEAVSGIAVANHLEIGFTPRSVALTDTTGIKNGIFNWQFSISGNYFDMIKMLDSLGRTKGIGKIYSLKVTSKDETQNETAVDQLVMQLNMVSVVK